ncbi:Transposon Ty3-G Gag-Pol polyprotein [Thelohanellus kitauei]|uniref:Transposon Ty3-G Gag-Pol polyprotein n=1 Tax=Thelohanellus kitauei TaxID=669202 RepID=A0A0C2N5C6_THEKT|nr:Transposon Ty3-G Gag-Pol polyprotein [Thelohanellus kitauei]
MNTLIDNGIIRPSSSMYCAPAVYISKKNGDIRICVEYRALNSITKRYALSLPLINDVQTKLHEETVFSTSDLRNGYWLIPLDDRDIEKTAFSFGHDIGL